MTDADKTPNDRGTEARPAPQQPGRGQGPSVPPVPPPPPPVLPRRMPEDTSRPTHPAQHVAAPSTDAPDVSARGTTAATGTPDPRYEPRVSGPGEDLPGAPAPAKEAPDRGVPESATLAGHAPDAAHPRHLTTSVDDGADAPTSEGGAPLADGEPTATSTAAPAPTVHGATSAPSPDGPRPAPVEEWLRQQVAEEIGRAHV